MAKAFTKLSEGGRPLTVLTLGPKEVSKALEILQKFDSDENISEICDVLAEAISAHERSGFTIPEWVVSLQAM